MAFTTTAIRYGWVALTSLGVLTGVTIYVVNNTRQQVKPEDIIELAIATDERAMGIQTADGTFPVVRPSFIRTWTSNVYTTNGVTIYTNIVTNTIGWHIDRDMMVSLDTTIKALVPYYVDTNSVYDGTTNIAMLTVTGLWASLQIGDKTNQFTRTPCWTNPVSINWIVNYTSYWPSTNGVAVTNCYTSDYRQVVNYAESWTATGGYVWVTSSNWASQVVTVTNAATYGDYPWQIYVEDLQERYKVLNALQWASNSYMWTSNQTIYVWWQAPQPSGLSPYWEGSQDAGLGEIYMSGTEEEAKAAAESSWSTYAFNHNYAPNTYFYYQTPAGGYTWLMRGYAYVSDYNIGPFPTNQEHAVIVQARSVRQGEQWSDQGKIGDEGVWVDIISATNSYTEWHASSIYGSLNIALYPTNEPWAGTHDRGNSTEVKYTTWLGPSPSHWTRNGDEMTNAAFGTNYVFYYATNKYW